MEMSIFWLVALVIFGIVEGLTVGLTSVWFALGSLAALIAALLGAPTPIQVVVFLVVSFLTLLLLRPLTKSYFNKGLVATNADRVIGAEAVVTEAIDNLNAQGRVTIVGMPWTARSVSGDPIGAGATVCVERIEGVKVFVSPVIKPCAQCADTE
ncbi:MAG: NfeD family protein [Clostridia bacterium]|nr:NfeD family protein [Clostridia bacterium]